MTRLPMFMATAIIGLWILTFIASAVVDRSLESLLSQANPVLLLAGAFLFGGQFTALLKSKGDGDEK